MAVSVGHSGGGVCEIVSYRMILQFPFELGISAAIKVPSEPRA